MPRPAENVSVMRPIAQRVRLLRPRLPLLYEQRLFRAGKDWNVLTGRPTQGTRQHGALGWFTAYRGYAKQLARRLSQQVRKTHCIVDISADVGVEQHFCRHS